MVGFVAEVIVVGSVAESMAGSGEPSHGVAFLTNTQQGRDLVG